MTPMRATAAAAILAMGLLSNPARPAEPAAPVQSGEERRRGDLSPMRLAGGSVVRFGSFASESLGRAERYSVFLPPSFEREPDRTYPVVYFLHGLNNDETSWTAERYGSLHEKVEGMILEGELPEFVMLHPDGADSFYCNTHDGALRYEDLVVDELVAYAEKTYRARKDRTQRAIAGTSMGGFGALKIAFKHPGRYAAVAGHSPIIFLGKNPLDVPETMRSSRFFQFFVSLLKPIFGDPLRQELWDRDNPLLLAARGGMEGLRIYFDYGTEDRYNRTIRLDEGVKELSRTLSRAGVEHLFREHPGEPHGWVLVAAHLKETLQFLCRSFDP